MTKRLMAGLVLTLTTCATAMAQVSTVKFNSPDGKLCVTISNENGSPAYEVSRNDVMFIGRSPLGLKTNVYDLTQGLTLKDSKTDKVHEEYSLKTIKQGQVVYDATEGICQFEKDGKQVMDIIFRVSNRDVAFRYKIYPKGETLACVVEGEATGCCLTEGTTTFLCPQSKPMGGFARTAPSYETSYTLDQPIGKNGWGEGYTFPCLFIAVIRGGA